MRTLRKLIFGETWTLPLTVGAALIVTAIVRAIAGTGGWWRSAGGFLLLVLVACAYLVATRAGRRT